MKIRRIVVLFLCLLALAVPARTLADQSSRPASVPVIGNAQVTASIKNDVSPALRSLPRATMSARSTHPLRRLPPLAGGSPNQLTAPVQLGPVTKAIPATSSNFDGISDGVAGFTVGAAPSDQNGAVGPNDYVQIVNTDVAVYNKTSGALLSGPVAINSLWSGFGGLCESDNDGDPVANYDRAADRWVLSQFAVSGADGVGTPFLECVAVSTSSDPTGTYTRYAFPYADFNDYPKFGVWPDGYYVTFNFFDPITSNFVGGEVCAYDRGRMLAGLSATQQCFTQANFGGLLPSDLEGAAAPPAGSPNYIVAINTSSSLAFWKFHVDWGTPGNSTLTGPTSIAVNSFAEACGGGTCIPQTGTAEQLDSLADRLMYRLDYRNFGDHEALVVNHSITAGSSVGIRWYEIRVAGGTPSLFQQGTYAPDSSYRWMGSIAMDKLGDMGLGFSVSSSTLHPEIHYTGRLVTDAAGTMAQGEGTIINGAGSQLDSPQPLSRWGDYSDITVDPTDDCTFWYTNQYIPADGEFNWKTKIASFAFPSCLSGGSTATATSTATRTVTPTFTVTLTKTSTPTVTNTATVTSTPTHTNTPTSTSTPLAGTNTRTNTPTVTSTATATKTSTSTATATSTPTPGSGGGTLSGSGTATSGAINLTTLGTADWAHWGLTTTASFDHKAAVTSQIPTFTLTSGGTVGRAGLYTNNYVWTDGTPTVSASTNTGLYLGGAGHGFQLVLPADNSTTRTIKLYLALTKVQAKLTATLSDGSAAPFTDTVDNPTGTTYRTYTLSYRAASAGKTLTVVWTLLTDHGGGSVQLHAAALSAPVSGGTLTGASATTSGAINLTTLGTSDWAHWGLTTTTSFDHKAAVTQQIPTFTLTTGGTVGRAGLYTNNYVWSDGTPTGSATTNTGLYLGGAGHGFQLVLPADNSTTRTLKLYLALTKVQAKLTATLSDGSAAPFTDTVDNATGTTYRTYTLTYKAGNPGQTLSVVWTLLTDHGGGSVQLHSATLS
jgi:hypothetical protein